MEKLSLCLKQYISEEDYNNIEILKNICLKEEKMFLKLELDYKLNVSQMNRENDIKNINEFFCYSGETLIGYIGICNFGGDAGELTGMVHPQYRRKGTFNRLYTLAKEECIRREFKRILLVCDNNSVSGLQFIRSTDAIYSFSEYEMKLDNIITSEESKHVTLRKASNSDAEEISRQNSIYFGGTYELIIMPEDEEKNNKVTYMIELNSKIIGKIKIDFDEKSGFISGFGILPEYRRNGFGRESIKAALEILKYYNIHSVGLEVAAENKNALNLYKACGFEEKSVMDYYETH
ncbi:GNAT family N-acetyltransferase [Clostridium omnivorum]|uniref:GNAT family N-acetyltransferase n=1 Tax=Clostridium omnivorum TaxID=1604902 RepID=A0ABQ5NC86_9CLOT|nr:GNAT family N-acetyltransferase [Clostridium sp. E14]GLC32868.1 GNAT family N-acetyltransferase [Clostridium sp. E14]